MGTVYIPHEKKDKILMIIQLLEMGEMNEPKLFATLHSILQPPAVNQIIFRRMVHTIRFFIKVLYQS